jgi:cobalamin biosynthesis protein CobT
VTLEDAIDVVDAFGPNPSQWPVYDRAAMESMVKTDSEFVDYVKQARDLDKLLDGWSEGDEGSDVGEDSDVKGDQGQDDDEDDQEQGEDQDDGEGVETPVGAINIDPNKVLEIGKMLAAYIVSQIEEDNGEQFRVFTRDYDRIVEIETPPNTSTKAIEESTAKSTGPLQKDLRRLIAAQTQSKRLPGKRSGKLHTANLHRITTGDDRVFFKREEAPQLDTAVSLLVDCSGSMRGSPIKLAAETAFALGSVFSKLGISFECLGFTCDSGNTECNTSEYEAEVQAAHEIAKITRSTPIIMPRFKSFDERWTQPVQRRFAHVFNKSAGIDFGHTPEGCGLEFIARRLVARPEKRKILISMTDGGPAGQCFSRTQYGAYARQSREVVKAISASQIDLVGIGIQHDGVRAYYPNSIVINKIDEMPQQLLALMKRFLIK